MRPDGEGLQETFGRYRLLEQLGAGGMGTVHRAVLEGARGFARPVVIKRMLPELVRDTEFANMMIREARVCALLHHPSIVHVQDFGEVDGELFLAMELVDGLDLQTVLRVCRSNNIMPPRGAICFVIAELAAALAYAHALTDETGRCLEIVHRDVSPSNIMLTHQGRVKLLDFGIARAVDTLRDEDTRTGAIKGKLGYMSPEQADAQPLDGRSDLFALGVVFWECLTMRPLFRGGSDLVTLRRIREAIVPPPSSLVPGLEPDIEAVVMKLLVRSPEARFADGDEVVAALGPIVHRMGADAAALRRFIADVEPAATLDRVQRVARASSTALTNTAQGSVRPPTVVQRPRPGRTRGLALGAAMLAAVGAAAFVLWPRDNATSPAAPVKRADVRIPAAPSPAPALPEPAPIEMVKLKVDGTPDAEVVLDGVSVGRIPLQIEVQKREDERSLVVRLADQGSMSKRIPGDREVMVTMELPPRTKRQRVSRPRPIKTSTEQPVMIKDPFARPRSP